MIRATLDPSGRLQDFVRVPPQRLAPEQAAPAIDLRTDWSAFFDAAGLNIAQFQPTDPLWTALASSDSRAAWLGPGKRPLRVEGASLHGHAVYFDIVHPWTQPSGQENGNTSSGETVTFSILAVVVVVVCLGAALLARRNLAQQRGDRRGAFRAAAFFFTMQMLLWLARAHLTASFGTFGIFLLALCTSVFYGVVIWTVYIALEPSVRRRWPQTLISWSSVLIGRVRDPVVGRDILVGAATGTGILLVDALLDLWKRHLGQWTPNLANSDVLSGARGALGVCFAGASHAIRETLFFFFLIFLLRVVLRNQWVAAAVFALTFTMTHIEPSYPVLIGAANFLIYGALAVVLLRWGVLALAIAIVVNNNIGNAPITSHSSAWYMASAVFMMAWPLALTGWAFRTAIAGRGLWNTDLFM